MNITKVKRCCRTCVHYYREDIHNIEQQRCDEGGFTEIGDPDRELTEEDCNAWESKIMGEVTVTISTNLLTSSELEAHVRQLLDDANALEEIPGNPVEISVVPSGKD